MNTPDPEPESLSLEDEKAEVQKLYMETQQYPDGANIHKTLWKFSSLWALIYLIDEKKKWWEGFSEEVRNYFTVKREVLIALRELKLIKNEQWPGVVNVVSKPSED